ncbi:unnamed protein product [Malus baccata var. baccata]
MSNSTVALPINLIPDEASPAWMNKGDNAWQLTAATLVYTNIPFWGKPNVALNQQYLLGIAFSGKIPNATMVYFQFVFAAITLILIAGALLGRMNFYAWMLFVPLWLTFSYTIAAFSIWSPNGFLAKKGIIDYSGGYVIHLSSGAAGFTAAYWVGPRSNKDRERFTPNNILLMLTGAGLLWMGWTGFNGGDPYVVSVDASLAVLNTHICTATSLLTWLLLDITFFRKPSVIGAVQGMITGLVSITPAAGVVQGWAAIIMGIFSGSIPWFTMMVVHKRSLLLQKLLVLYQIWTARWLILRFPYGRSQHRLSSSGNPTSRDLLCCYTKCCVVTSIICLVIQSIMPLRMSTEDMEIGDEAAHGEEAYAIWGQGEKLGNSKSGYDIESSAAKSRKAARQIEMV